MTLELKYFIGAEKTAKEYPVLLTDGVKKKDEDGKKVLKYELNFIKAKDFTKYQMYPVGTATKAIIPTVTPK